MATRKSTIKIPVHAYTGNVPHWTQNATFYEERRKIAQSILDEGFVNRPKDYYFDNNETEEKWFDRIHSQIADNTYEWKEPWEFVDTYEIESYGRGRSAAYFHMRSKSTDASCVMMMTDMSHMIINANINKGVVTGRWIFVKRGANYGIHYLGEQ